MWEFRLKHNLDICSRLNYIIGVFYENRKIALLDIPGWSRLYFPYFSVNKLSVWGRHFSYVDSRQYFFAIFLMDTRKYSKGNRLRAECHFKSSCLRTRGCHSNNVISTIVLYNLEFFKQLGCTVETRFSDTRLIRTPRYYEQFPLSLGKEKPYLRDWPLSIAWGGGGGRILVGSLYF